MGQGERQHHQEGEGPAQERQVAGGTRSTAARPTIVLPAQNSEREGKQQIGLVEQAEAPGFMAMGLLRCEWRVASGRIASGE